MPPILSQEEALLGCLLAVAISLLLLSLRPDNATDYVYAALFLTCTTSVLKLRWFVGTLALVAPVLVAVATNLRVRLPAAVVAAASGLPLHGTCAALAGGADGNADTALAACLAANASNSGGSSGYGAGQAVASGGLYEFATVGPLPLEALVHILVAWAVGALMAYVSGEPSRQTGRQSGSCWRYLLVSLKQRSCRLSAMLGLVCPCLCCCLATPASPPDHRSPAACLPARLPCLQTATGVSRLCTTSWRWVLPARSWGRRLPG